MNLVCTTSHSQTNTSMAEALFNITITSPLANAINSCKVASLVLEMAPGEKTTTKTGYSVTTEYGLFVW